MYGDAGSGKSALIKQAVAHFSDGTALLAFKSTDMDVDDKLKFLNLHGTLVIDEVLDVYKEADNRILYIDAVEKYFVLEYQQTFEDILQVFMNAGWKLVLTIRTAYKESFHNPLLNETKVQQYHVDSLSYDKLSELSITYGFRIPRDKKLTDILCAPFYLGLYLALDNLEDEEMLALNREAFEKKYGKILYATTENVKIICQPEEKMLLRLLQGKCSRVRVICMLYKQQTIMKLFLNWNRAVC